MMRRSLVPVIAGLLVLGCEESPSSSSSAPAPAGPITVEAPLVSTVAFTDERVEAGCGMCIYRLDADQCIPAVVIDGQTLLVSGVESHDHSLCEGTHEALVSGEIKDGRFVATSFEVLD